MLSKNRSLASDIKFSSYPGKASFIGSLRLHVLDVRREVLKFFPCRSERLNFQIGIVVNVRHYSYRSVIKIFWRLQSIALVKIKLDLCEIQFRMKTNMIATCSKLAAIVTILTSSMLMVQNVDV